MHTGTEPQQKQVLAASDSLILPHPTGLSLANIPCTRAKLETRKSLEQKDDFLVVFYIPATAHMYLCYKS